jgi:glycosyltransferase involved in cell wall biosynthesis
MCSSKPKPANLTKGDLKPWFSIIISVYNRPKQIERCLKSCLAQDFANYEIIVVDDGSQDDTTDKIEAFCDSRIMLIKHQANLGMSAALHTATEQARGQWVVRIDSDHALLPNALSTFFSHMQNLHTNIGVLGARYQWDDGRVTPRCIPVGTIDYIGRIKWVEDEGGSDYLSCVRSDVLEKVRWGKRRGSATALFQYEIARQTEALILNDILAIEYTDASNSFHRARRRDKLQNRLDNASDQAEIYDEVLNKHGQALMEYGQYQYQFFLLMAGFNHFLAANRKAGAARILKFLRLRSTSFEGWGVLFAGLISTKLLGFFYLVRKSSSF